MQAFQETIDVYLKRAKEVRRHLEFVQQLIGKSANALASIDDKTTLVHRDFTIDRGLIKSLNATGYLLIYNLVECTMTNAIDSIHSHLENLTLHYDSLTEKLQRIALRSFKVAIEQGVVIPSNHPISIAMVTLGYDKNRLFSGNVDGKKIREIAEKYGFDISHDRSLSRNGARLLEVKTKRNELAHGKTSFEECGQDTSIEELIQIFDETEVFLGATLQGIRDYLLEGRFLKATQPA